MCPVADQSSADCEMALSGGHDRTLVVGPSNANKCGGELFPWRLTVDDGQRVNVTLVQFAAGVDDHDDEDPDDSTLSAAASHDDQYHVSVDTEHDHLAPVNTTRTATDSTTHVVPNTYVQIYV